MAINLHTPRITNDCTNLADWLEFEALTSENGSGSLAELACQLGIAGSGDAEAEAVEEPRQFMDSPKLDAVMSELETRSSACNDGYPFVIDSGGNLISKKENYLEHTYTSLLLMSLIDCSKVVKTKDGDVYPARAFEAICVKAAEKYLGGSELGARAYHFAFPRPDGSNFSDALDSLAKCINGRRLSFLEPDAEQDDSLDILAWRSFPDAFSNQICVFGQCGTGDEWGKKVPAPLEFLNLWLRLEAPPVTPALFVPFTLEKAEWMKKAQSAIIFDRCRISYLEPRFSTPSLAATLLTA